MIILKYNNKTIKTSRDNFFHDVCKNFDINIYNLLFDLKLYCFLPKEYVNIIKEDLIKRASIEKYINEYLKYELLILKLLNNIQNIIVESKINDDDYRHFESNIDIFESGGTQSIKINSKEMLKALDIEILEWEINNENY